jgi:hypothetical protein
LLVHLDDGWEAWPIVWNDEQTDAFYDPAGETKTITLYRQIGQEGDNSICNPNKNHAKDVTSESKMLALVRQQGSSTAILMIKSGKKINSTSGRIQATRGA